MVILENKIEPHFHCYACETRTAKTRVSLNQGGARYTMRLCEKCAKLSDDTLILALLENRRKYVSQV